MEMENSGTEHNTTNKQTQLTHISEWHKCTGSIYCKFQRALYCVFEFIRSVLDTTRFSYIISIVLPTKLNSIILPIVINSLTYSVLV